MNKREQRRLCATRFDVKPHIRRFGTGFLCYIHNAPSLDFLGAGRTREAAYANFAVKVTRLLDSEYRKTLAAL